MLAIYIVYMLTWLVLCCYYRADILRIQYWIGGVILLGMIDSVILHHTIRGDILFFMIRGDILLGTMGVTFQLGTLEEVIILGTIIGDILFGTNCNIFLVWLRVCEMFIRRYVAINNNYILPQLIVLQWGLKKKFRNFNAFKNTRK